MIDGKRWLFVTRKHMAVADRCLKYLKVHEEAKAPADGMFTTTLNIYLFYRSSSLVLIFSNLTSIQTITG